MREKRKGIRNLVRKLQPACFKGRGGVWTGLSPEEQPRNARSPLSRSQALLHQGRTPDRKHNHHVQTGVFSPTLHIPVTKKNHLPVSKSHHYGKIMLYNSEAYVQENLNYLL